MNITNFWKKVTKAIIVRSLCQGLFFLGSVNPVSVKAMNLSTGFTDSLSIADFSSHQRAAMAVAFSPDGRLLVSGHSDGSVCIWPAFAAVSGAQSAQILPQATILHGHAAQVYAVAFNQQGTMLASASGDKTIRLWRVENGQVQEQGFIVLEGHTDIVTSIAFNPAGTALFSGSYDGTVRLWRLGDNFDQLSDQAVTSEIVFSEAGLRHFFARKEVRSIAIDPAGRLLVAGFCDGKILAWHIEGDSIQSGAGIEIPRFFGSNKVVESLAFNAQGSLLAACSENYMFIWRLSDDRLRFDLQREWYAPNAGNSVVFHSHYSCLVCAADIGFCAHSFDNGFSDEQMSSTFDSGRHSEAVASLAFNADGSLLASGDFRGHVRLWRVRDFSPGQVALADRIEEVSGEFLADSSGAGVSNSDATVLSSQEAQEDKKDCFICLQEASEEQGRLQPIPCRRIIRKELEGKPVVCEVTHPGFVHTHCWQQWRIDNNTCPICRGRFSR